MNNKRVPIYFLIFVSLAPIALLSACVDLVVDITGIRVLSYAGGNRIGAGDFEKPDLFKIGGIADGDYIYSLNISGKGVVNDKLTVTRGTATIRGSVLSLSDWNSLDDGEVLIVLTIVNNNIEFTYSTTKEQYEIRSWQDLQGMEYDLNGDYKLMNNIELPDPSTMGGAFPEKLPAEGFNPIGYRINNDTYLFKGSFNGQNNIISNFFIERGENFVGLFGRTDSAVIKNVGMEISAGGVTGRDYVGSLVGYAYKDTITNSYAKGDVTGNNFVGGLVGTVYGSNSTITNSYATGDVRGSSYVGGLVGYNDNFFTTITNSYATGNVTGTDYVSGLVGRNSGGTITSSYWDIASTGQTTSDGGTGISKATKLAKNGGSYYDTGPNPDVEVFVGWGFGNDDNNPWKWQGNGKWPVLYY